MSRALTFWTDANIRLIKEHFVAAAVPTWVCRANSPEGEFLRGAGIDKQWVTSSGYMTCVSPGGKMLGHTPSPKVLEEVLDQATTAGFTEIRLEAALALGRRAEVAKEAREKGYLRIAGRAAA